MFFLGLLTAGMAHAQHDAAFHIYNSKGKRVSYKKMMKQLSGKDVVLFGELHNNPIAHWLQIKVSRSLLADGPIVMGAEMIEADNQEALNRYLSGEIDHDGLDSLARLWPNYVTDYKPLVDIALEVGFPFIATNVPRRYASKVYREGVEALEELSEEDKAWIAPLPFPYDSSLSQYQAMLEMMGGHGGENFPKAQAIKDATMAWFIVQNLQPGSTFIHFHGSFHSNYYQGIMWYLNEYREGLTIATINTILAEDISKVDKAEFETADFIIAVDHEMTVTH